MADERDINQVVKRNILDLMERAGTNPSRLSKDAGLSHTAIRDFFARENASLRIDTLARIAEALGVTVEAILSFDRQVDREIELIRAFRALSEEQKRLLVLSARAWSETA